MMKKSNCLRMILLVALFALLIAGCAKKPAPDTDTTGEAPGVTGEAPRQEEVRRDQEGGVRESRITEAPIAGETAAEETTPAAKAAQSTPELQRIFFDYDQYTLTENARQTLAANAEYMKQRPQASFVIEGHCDERGSDEYNLALGERRARAARDYLISLGIPGDRLTAVSFGEERPLVQGGDEESWAQNRRAEFLLR